MADEGSLQFVSLGGPAPKKRPRRRYDEIERLYTCGWNGCEKSYGTLNHLNAHVAMQKHGEKRLPTGKSLRSHHSLPLLTLDRIQGDAKAVAQEEERADGRCSQLAVDAHRRLVEPNVYVVILFV